MRSRELWSWVERYGWPLLILLLAAVLRFHDLANIPPGLTHDEADHGLTAWQIVTGNLREIYFTIGYGREPLYDYIVAAVMAFLGPSILAGRLVSVFASLIMIAAMMAWVKHAFGRSTALMTGAGLAVGFWPLMSGRQALRSILLPALFVLAVLLFWLALKNVVAAHSSRTGEGSSFWHRFHELLPFATAGILLGLTFYTYIPARALWIIFPALLLFWFVRERNFIQPMWWRIAIMLLVMIAVAAPLLVYLGRNPSAEARIDQLAEPLYLAQQGDWSVVAGQSLASMRLFFVEGDPAWRYNIAGRPFLTPVFAVLFLLGIAQTIGWLFTGKDSSSKLLGSVSFLALAWLVVGFVPVLITGPALSMTQAIAVQPLIYLFPAVALAAGGKLLAARTAGVPRFIYIGGVVLLYAALALFTWRDYFQIWANNPEVRVQYETTLATAIDYLNTDGRGEIAISTITPGRYHSPALAEMTLTNRDVTLRWFDGRGSLLLPRTETAMVVVPGFTPLPPLLFEYFATAELIEDMPLRETDHDRPLRIYEASRADMVDDWRSRLTPAQARFGDTITLTGFDLQSQEVKPGEQVSLITQWQALQPLEEAVLFTHLLGPDGVPLAQNDRLDVPGYSWTTGDSFLQLHQFTLPDDLDPGSYSLAVGLYSLTDGRRIPLADAGGGADLFPVTSVVFSP